MTAKQNHSVLVKAINSVTISDDYMRGVMDSRAVALRKHHEILSRAHTQAEVNTAFDIARNIFDLSETPRS